MANNLESIISSLRPNYKNSIWHDYTKTNTYEIEDSLAKRNFISQSLSKFKDVSNLIDFGCNTGEYSIICEGKYNVVSCDIDSACIDDLYLNVKSNNYNITPIVLDLMNPSAQCGWKLHERRSIYERLHGNAFLALALIHHVCIASNVPLENFIEFLASIAPQGIIEWVDKKDPMVRFLLQNREDVFNDYSWEDFNRVVSKYFKIDDLIEINNGTRKLCRLTALN